MTGMLKGKRTLVTSAANGIGRAIEVAFAAGSTNPQAHAAGELDGGLVLPERLPGRCGYSFPVCVLVSKLTRGGGHQTGYCTIPLLEVAD